MGVEITPKRFYVHRRIAIGHNLPGEQGRESPSVHARLLRDVTGGQDSVVVQRWIAFPIA
jgi:hypothetical protein